MPRTFTCLIALLFLACQHPAARAPADQRANLILITVDTLRRDHVGIYGYSRPTTPHIDHFARSSLVFDDAIAVYSQTAPAHASLFTGMDPIVHGLLHNGAHLRPGVPTLASMLSAAGYQSAAFVSGFSLANSHTGLGRGFGLYDDNFDSSSGDSRDPAPERRAADTVQQALHWLERRAHPPFFLFVHLFDPHYPYDAPQPFLKRMQHEAEFYRFPVHADLSRLRSGGARSGELAEYGRRYDAEVAYADEQLDKLFAALEERHLFEHSFVVLLADHGETLDERPWVLDHGGRVTEEQIRIPLVVRPPGGAKGRVSGAVHQLDVFPTLLAAAGLTVPKNLPGRSLLRAPATQRLLISHAWSLPQRRPGTKASLAPGLITALRAWPWKLVQYPKNPSTGAAYTELYDLEHDPTEQRNLARERPKVTQLLKQELQKTRSAAAQHDMPPAEEPPASVREALRSLGYTW